MKIAPIAEIKAHFSAYVKESENGPIIVTKNGKPVAVLVGVTDEEEIERLIMGYSPKFQSILDRGRQQIKDDSGIPHEDFWKELEAEMN
jgi:prevent-host-death family protein